MAVTDEQISRVVGAVPKGLLIGGKWIDTESKVAVENPATGLSPGRSRRCLPGTRHRGIGCGRRGVRRVGRHRPAGTR